MSSYLSSWSHTGYICNLYRSQMGSMNYFVDSFEGNPEHSVLMPSGKPSVQQYPRYTIPATTVLQLLPIDFDCLPCTVATREESCECYAGVTICNIKLQKKTNFSHCMHSISPLLSIIISTTITITAITITTITITITITTFTTITITIITITTIAITNIGYYTLRLFFDEPGVTPPYQRGPILRNQLAPSEATITRTSDARSTATSLLPAKPVPPLPAKPDPPLPACSQRSHVQPYQRSPIYCYRLAPSGASFTPTGEAWSTANSSLPAKPVCQRGVCENSTATSLLPDCQRGESEHSTASGLLPAKPDPLLPAKPDPPLTAFSQRRQSVRELRVSIPPLPACSWRSQIHCYKRS